MKKIFIILIFCVLLVAAIVTHRVLALQNVQAKTVQINESNYAQNIYTPAFPLIFEDLQNEIVKGKVELIGFKSAMIETLEALETPKNRISEEFYYKTIARKTLASKRKIEKDIKEKFNETSEILDKVRWLPENEESIILYSMVKKNVEFLKPFEISDPMAFNNSDGKFKYFGTKDRTEYFKDQTKPLFYKDENNYAISLKTKTGDEVIFYMTEDIEKKPVYELWNDLGKKIKDDTFKEDDRFLAPFVKIKETVHNSELEGKVIKGTDFFIALAMESVDFSLDNEGAKLKNEALMQLDKSMAIEINPRYFYFNKPFVLFIKEHGRENPYFMVKIQDAKYLVEP